MKKTVIFSLTLIAVIQMFLVNSAVNVSASDLTEYNIDTSAYEDADTLFNKCSAKLKRQNYSEGNGQVYEINDNMIRISNKSEMTSTHVCMDFFGNWQQTSDTYSKLRLRFSISTEDKLLSKNVVARFYHYTNNGTRVGIFDDTIINLDSDGNMKCSMKTIGAYELNKKYAVDYIVDLKTGYRRLYIDDALVAEATDESIAKYNKSDYVIFNNARFQYGAQKVSDGKYLNAEVAYGDISYKYYDSCTRFTDEKPYIEENYISFKNPVFVSNSEGETSIVDYVPYDVDTIRLGVEGGLSADGINPEMITLKSDKTSVPIKEVTYADNLLTIKTDALNISKTKWNLCISGDILLINGNKAGREFNISFTTGPKPFDITAVNFSKSGKLNKGERVSAEVTFRNVTGDAKSATVVIMSYGETGRLNGMKAKSGTISKDNQTIVTDDLVVGQDNSEIRLYAVNSWLNPISIDNIVYTNNQ